MLPGPEVDLTGFPADCDAFGHLNHAACLALFERARWELFQRGPGMDVFSRNGAWPAVRKLSMDYHAPAAPGDVLRFQTALTHHGRTSFTLRQTARRPADDRVIATGEVTFVCVDREGHPVPVPIEASAFLTMGPLDGAVRRYTVNGVRLPVSVAGEGPAILFIHGYPLNRAIWRHQIEHLEGWLRIAPDLRGMGEADAPDLGYSMSTYAGDLAALLDALGVERVVLCGLSMGGYIAFEFLRRWRERVRGLILMDTRAEADSAEGRRARDLAAQTAREHGAAAIADAMLPKLLLDPEPHPGSVADEVRRMIRATPVAGIAGALAAMRDRPDSTPLLSTLEGIPTLVLLGEDDRITPLASARLMAETVPGARLVVIDDAGHVPCLEAPAATTGAIGEFLATLTGRA